MRWLTVSAPGQPTPHLVLCPITLANVDESEADHAKALLGKGVLGAAFLASDNARAAHDRLVADGVEVIQPPTKQPYGVDCAVRDPFGNQVRIAQNERGCGVSAALKSLEPFVGQWAIEVTFPGAPPIGDIGARATFEFMPGERFLIQRWEVPVPEAPDGIAVIGFDEGRDTLLQHYFDTRGVARVYEMSFADGVWNLSRDTPDFSPLDFSQRFLGTFNDDGRTIKGAWENCHDGSTWEHDFDMTYTRV